MAVSYLMLPWYPSLKPVENKLKILWCEVQEFPPFPQDFLGPFCTDCFPGESEYFGASWTKKELCHVQAVSVF